MIKCPSCGHENVPGTQFCEGCGEELPQDNGAATSAPAALQSMVKCPACDNMNPADNVACEVCGADLTGVGGSTASPAPTSIPTPTVTPSDDAASGDSLPINPVPADLSAPNVGAFTPGNVASTDTASTTPLPSSPVPDTSLPTAPVTASGVASTDMSAGDAPVSLVAPIPPTPPMPPSASLPAGDLEPGKVKLVVEQGQTVGAQFVLGDAEMLVGREDTDEDIYPDIDLSDQDAGYVHRKHASLRFDNGNLTVEHLGGSNKTRINNKPIADNQPQAVKLGDKVSFGKVVLRVMPA